MSWDSVWKIALSVVASFGGIAGIIAVVIKFSVNQITDRLNAKFEASLKKELERYKSLLSKGEHISKERFDREFTMYQELSEKHMTVVYDMGTAVLITRGAKYPGYEKTSDFVHLAAKHLDEAEMMNKRYAPFISKEIFENYKELGKQAYSIISLLDLYDMFDNQVDPIIKYHHQSYTKAQAKQEIEDRQKTLSKLSDDILDKLREYLSRLEAVEEK